MSLVESLIDRIENAKTVAEMRGVVQGQKPELIVVALQDGRFHFRAPEKYLLLAGTGFSLKTFGCDITPSVRFAAQRILEFADLDARTGEGNAYSQEILDLALKF